MRLKDDTGKGDFTNAFRPVLHTVVLVSFWRLQLKMTCLLITWTSLKLLRKSNCNRATAALAIYTFPLLLVFPRILPIVIASTSQEPPLYGIPSTSSASSAWFQTMSTFLKQEVCTTVGYEESMWKTTVHGHDILLVSHIDDTHWPHIGISPS